jgi:hypothetical protein
MVKHARSVFVVPVLLATAAAIGVGAARSKASGLTVHEWGTFTSVAGSAGQAVDWTPLSGPQDLPCFVSHLETTKPLLTSVQVKGRDVYGLLKLLPSSSSQPGASAAPLPRPTPRAVPPQPGVPPAFMVAKVRMETPVLYFYSADPLSVSVKVSFDQGVMSEWYPTAVVPRVNLSQPLARTVGTIEWPEVNVVPKATVAFPRDEVKSHYYAAREVDASPLRVGSQYEKFLFYRGLADFTPSISATIEPNGDVTAMVPDNTPSLVLFENHGGRLGYRVAHGQGTRVTFSQPSLTGSLEGLRAELESMLTAEGLYPREARAMVETWRDSWFEEGTRIFYITPKAAVDARLPLSISPTPADVRRVFVGRLELITPEMKDDVERAIVNNDLDALNRYGRFLDTIAQEIADRPAISQHPERIGAALRAVALSRPTANACQ